MTSVITGAGGFLGWHLACRLKATRGVDAVRMGRHSFGTSELDTAVDRAEVIYHVAGVNRGESDDEVESGNVDLAARLAERLAMRDRPVHVVYANSVQARLDNAYGRGKTRAANLLAEATEKMGGSFSDVLLPNLFGEHGRPQYNSFVATFCGALAAGQQPIVTGDREIPVLLAQRAAEVLIAAGERRESGTVEPVAQPRLISEVLATLVEYRRLYDLGEVPDLSHPFAVDLFNTYRSFTFPGQFPMHPPLHSDPRGNLFETVRVHGGTGQAFVSTTSPAAIRGEHYHLHKFERFFVVAGEAEINVRKLYSDEVHTFRLSGEEPGFVDMPTMWVHNIRNIGHDDLVTMFWSDQLLDPERPDQYPLRVVREEQPA